MENSLKYGLYTKEELEKLQKEEEFNIRLEKNVTKKIEDWSKKLMPIHNLFRTSVQLIKPDEIMDCLALALSYRQIMIDDVTKYIIKRQSVDAECKILRQDKIVFYTHNTQASFKSTDKTVLIAGHLSQLERRVAIIDSYIEYLNKSAKNLESFQFAIKNVIELINTYGLK